MLESPHLAGVRELALDENALTADEVQQIGDAVITQANVTRAVIRLPIGSRAKFVIAVADLDGAAVCMANPLVGTG